MNTKTKPGFFVQGRQLFTKDGEPVVLRGVNHMFIWTDRTGKTLREIARTGANCVRIVWNTSGRVSDLERLIRECIRHNMIPIPELHDATGRWERFPDIMDFWMRTEVVDMLIRHQEYLILNLANEPADAELEPQIFFDTYRIAVTRLRAAGIRVPIMLDADGWGQSTGNLFLQGPALLQTDPEHNLLFSVHMWWPSERHDAAATGYATVAERVTGTLEKSIELGLPLVVGEFAPVAVGGVGEIPYLHIISECERLYIGWLAWSWGPGNLDSPELDMTELGSFNTLRGWGKEICLTHTNSIQNTSKIPTFILGGNYPADHNGDELDLVENGDFSEGLEGWNTNFWGGLAEVRVEHGVISFDIRNAGLESWTLQFGSKVSLQENCTYLFTMRAKADSPRTLNVNIKKDSDDFIPYANGRLIDLSTVWQEYGWKFTMKETSDPRALLTFDMGGNATGWSLGAVSLLRTSANERLHRSFHRNVQKNSGFFNAPNNPWELQLFSVEGRLLEVLDKGRGGEGMRPYPKLDRDGILVLKDA